jgi:hypothetical protein
MEATASAIDSDSQAAKRKRLTSGKDGGLAGKDHCDSQIEFRDQEIGNLEEDLSNIFSQTLIVGFMILFFFL